MNEAETIGLHFRERPHVVTAELPALIFLHYFGGSGRAWEGVMQALAAVGFRCIASDLRGFGDSPDAGEDMRQYSVALMADDVLELVRAQKIESYVVVGHSMGGKVALSLASRRPAGLRALVLLAPSPATPEPMTDEERNRLLNGFENRASAEQTLREITAEPISESLAAVATEDSLRASAPAWRAWLESGSRESIVNRLADIDVPVSIAVGGKDKTITRALVQNEIAAWLTSGASIDTIDESGHLLPLEAPEAVAEFIQRSISSS